ncbi:hypothetical protein E2C01_082252 [Portunus trituberculatus]|uniref:Uncharacterized protein n=1 Tax=Portunus trituberculatus TaxID=210409 RepID=A0A5B7IPF1_PORTR|nr:hypothetical protein [Portunus trituberculatus]
MVQKLSKLGKSTGGGASLTKIIGNPFSGPCEQRLAGTNITPAHRGSPSPCHHLIQIKSKLKNTVHTIMHEHPSNTALPWLQVLTAGRSRHSQTSQRRSSSNNRYYY